MSRALTKRKQRDTFLKKVNAQALQQTLKDLDRAYTNKFEGRAKLPRFKHRRGRQSFRVPQSFRIEEGRLKIPKVDSIKIILHRELPGTPKHVTIIRESDDRYYASFCCEVPDPQPIFDGNVIGIDLGIKHFLVTSDGEKVENPQHLERSLKKLRRLDRRVSRKRKGSKNREKARRRLARQHAKVRHQRQDFLHKLSRRLVDENQAIGIETLAVKNMMKNHSLARRIGAVGWSEFVRQLEYKGTWHGCAIRKVDRFFPSSKRCSACGWIKEDLKLQHRQWQCEGCETQHDRDVNAAINILKFSTAGSAGIHARGDGRLQVVEKTIRARRRSGKYRVGHG